MDSGGSLNPLLQKTGPAFDPSNEKFFFCSQRGKSGSASDGVTYEVKGLFIKIKFFLNFFPTLEPVQYPLSNFISKIFSVFE